jgi:two-component system, cell cycle sensor histidine kinase and response regulator CckA
VLEARDGEDALLVSRKHRGRIHLMVTDVVMPRMGGPKLAERLAEERPDMKVLFVSGYAENTVLQHGKIDVATCFLQKPFSLKALARNVREVLETGESCALATTSRS